MKYLIYLKIIKLLFLTNITKCPNIISKKLYKINIYLYIVWNCKIVFIF